MTLFGRDRELSGVATFVSAVPDGSASLLFEGQLGVGKSALLRASMDLARAAGLNVVVTRPVQGDMALEYAGLADLIDGFPTALIDALPEPQRAAIRVAVLRTDLAGEVLDPRTTATAMLALFRASASIAPLLIVVDDLPWLDPPSARVLSFAMRRAGASRIGMLAAARTGWTGDDRPQPEFDFDLERLQRVPVDGLDVRALGALARDAGRAFRPAELDALHDACGGNPLLALELVSRGAGEGRSEVAQQSATLRQLVSARITGLPAAQRWVLLLAALGRDPGLSALRDAALRNPAVTVPSGADVDDLVRDELLLVRAERVSFSHPLIRSVVLGAATAVEERTAHRCWAEVAEPAEVRARHVALAADGADETAAAAAEEAAAIAAERGAHDVAAQLAELGSRLTPPARRVDRRRRIALEAACRYDSSDPTTASRLLEPLVAELERGPDRAELLRRLGRYRLDAGGSYAEWVATLRAALDDVDPGEVGRAEIHADLAAALSNSGDSAGAFAACLAAREDAVRAGDKEIEAQTCAGLAWMHFMAGEGVRPDLVSAGLSAADPPGRISMERRPRIPVALIRLLVGEVDGARDLFDLEYASALRRGDEAGLPLLLWGLVQAEVFAGNLSRAKQLANEGHSLAVAAGSPPALMFTALSRALALAYVGRIDEAERDTATAIAIAGDGVGSFALSLALQAVGVGRLSAGDASGTHEILGGHARTATANPSLEPGLLRFVVDDVEALARLRRPQEAARLLDPFEAAATRLGRDWATGAAQRCRGLIFASAGDLTAAEAAVGAAVGIHESLDLPLDHARTLLVAGEVHRRARHRRLAQQRLGAAAEIFAAHGAPVWAARATAESERIAGQRARREDTTGLTDAERRVAAMATDGATNAEIAAALFLSRRTVEAHLAHVYRKLGVSSRTAMAKALTHGSAGPA